MSNVIHIRFHENLVGVTPEQTRMLNKMRYGMELRAWKLRRDAAEEEGRYEDMDRLAVEYEMIGLP
ncbi:MAG: hypothetical protein Tp138OMZ00d2C19078261_9 [Prokaryotic dsDNA virus sp.]|jgi:hypothetical protein|nr:MAG: hypothetical protein Tp138OMZ00d2C19078261_9 [Prokaryotic dsDNA virus sp.]